MVKISVIVPTYKPEKYIWECLESIKNQTLDKRLFEVLIILNGKKGPYFNNISEYILKNKLSNFILIYTKKQGVSNARNIGLNKMKGEYVIFLDDDDYFSNNYLENCLKKTNKNTIVVANNVAFEDGSRNELKSEKILIKEFNYRTTDLIKLRKIFSVVWMKMIPINIIDKVRFDTELKNGEDSLFMLKISNKIKYIEILDEKTIYYRRVRKNSAYYGEKTIIEIMEIAKKQFKRNIKLLTQKNYSKKLIFFRILAIFKGVLILIKFNILKNIKK